MDCAQIFLSYARSDDAPPPHEPSKKGFVTNLCAFLRERFPKSSKSPILWRDIAEVGSAHQFDPKIASAIEVSDLFMVVLSPNWLESEYCRKELDYFTDFRRKIGESEERIRERVVVVCKRSVPFDRRPSLLQGQQGFEFYAVERVGGRDIDREFYRYGELSDRQRFFDRIDELSAHLMGQAEPEPTPRPFQRKTRKIFLAKPASDMAAAYDRLTRELEGWGYEVSPARAEEIPNDRSALDFVDAALSEAEISIHLLGESVGRSPEDLPPISKLQLERAALRAGGSDAFHRLIWAPEQLATKGKPSRDPLAALAQFHCQLAGDKIFGKEISGFVDFVYQRLSRFAPPVDERAQIPAEASVYVYHHKADEDYAIQLKLALEQRKVEVELPASGSDVEMRNFHRKKLRECDAVALCWARASEAWVRSSADELKSWRVLGRNEPFVFRGVVTGPPPDSVKRKVKEKFPYTAIDRFLDLEDSETPLPELLDDLIPHSPRA